MAWMFLPSTCEGLIDRFRFCGQRIVLHSYAAAPSVKIPRFLRDALDLPQARSVSCAMMRSEKRRQSGISRGGWIRSRRIPRQR